MLKQLKSVSTLLFLLGISTGATYAATDLGVTDVRVTQQRGICTGVVKDATGEPIIGASVLVKDAQIGAITDIDGNFSIDGVSKGSTLIVSFVGYETQEVKWTGTSLDVTLKDDSKLLDEVVVVGYSTQKKVNVTGAVSMVGSEVVESRPVANVTQALQGAIPGLNITASASGGDLNSSMSINIRGTGSISSNDDPLVLIDGIEGDLTLVNPNDIENISVLKDAASASIYGSRAAFGVVLVTTKNGKSGKVKINYSGDVRFSTATQLPDMVDSYTFANYWNAASTNSGSGNYFTDEIMEKIVKFQAGEYTDPSKPEYYGTTLDESTNKWNQYGSAFANTDWFDEFYNKNVPSTQHNLTLSGGTEKFNWLLSGSYFYQNGLIRHGDDNLQRYTFNAKIGAQLAEWARVEYASKWTRKDYTKPAYLTGLFFHNIARRWPTCFPIDPNGHWAEGMEIAELEDGGIYEEHNDLYTQQLKFIFEPIKNWHINVEGSIRINNEKAYESELPVYAYYGDDTPYVYSSWVTESYVYENRYRQNYYTFNAYTDYSRNIGKHNAKVLLGMNYERYNEDNMWGEGYDLTTTDKAYLSQTQSDRSTGGNYWRRATAGYFGRINYDYDGRYLLEFNLRYDGSSRFVGNKRWAWFPSVSAGWNIARESFFQKWTDKIDMLKFRLSWGQLGNTNSDYSSFSDWYPFYQQQSVSASSGSWLIDGTRQNTSSIPSIVSSELTWETIDTWDWGLDWSAFNNRLTGTFDYFIRTTKDMIGPAPTLGSALGTSAPQVNNCDMRSQGWELEIGWRDRIGKVKYGVRFNISDSQSKILTYPNETGSLSNYYNGRKIGEIWGYTTHGIASSQTEMDNWLASNNPSWGSNWSAGDIMYTDLDGDGDVDSGDYTVDDHGDMKIIGNTTPRYRVGLNLDLEWKGIDFSVFFQGVLKRDYSFGTTPYYWGASSGGVWQSCCYKEHLDYWTEDNLGAFYPKPYFGNSKNMYTQTRYIEDASYIRCKNMQIGYTFPTSWMSRAGIERCRVYVSVDNLFTITGLSSIFDPEAINDYGNSGWGNGKTYPIQRTWSFGVSLSF